MAFLPTSPLPRPLPPTTTTIGLPSNHPTMKMAASSPSLPRRIISTPLPNLLIYEHCPFCIRVHHLLGLKNVKHNLQWLANDDIDTPTSLVGRKITPVFQPVGPSGPSGPFHA